MVSAWSFGTSLRDRGRSNDTPGPGSYQPLKNPKQVPPQWKMGSSNRSSLLLNNSPGPGSYQVKPRFGNEGSKYSIVGKSQTRPLTAGSCNSLQKIQNHLLQYFMNAAANQLQFFSQQNIEPGPGAYNPNASVSMTNLPKYTFSSKGMNVGDRVKTPGPGTYSHSSTVLNRPSMIFPKSNRNELYYAGKTPGPGSYSRTLLGQTEGPKFGFGTSTREDFNHTGRQAPGPGNYNMSSSFTSLKGVSMSFRQKLPGDNEKVPGPGTYNPSLTMKKSAPSFKIGSASRNGNYGDINQPGPGAYQPRMYNRPSTPSIKMGSDIRKPLSCTEFTPGPGQYSLPGTNTGPKLTIKGSTAVDPVTLEKTRVPGPGQYQPHENYSSVKQRPSSARIGSGQRSNFLSTTPVPGPGNYQLMGDSQGPKWGFGTSQQRIDNQTKIHANEPGPGAYKLKPFFADVPSYLMPHRPPQ